MESNIPELISAIAAVISLPISILAIISNKKNSKEIKQMEKQVNNLTISGNQHTGSGTGISIGSIGGKN